MVARFNERFLLSLTACQACIVMDDELNVLPISSHIRTLEPAEPKVMNGLTVFEWATL